MTHFAESVRAEMTDTGRNCQLLMLFDLKGYMVI